MEQGHLATDHPFGIKWGQYCPPAAFRYMVPADPSLTNAARHPPPVYLVEPSIAWSDSDFPPLHLPRIERISPVDNGVWAERKAKLHFQTTLDGNEMKSVIIFSRLAVLIGREILASSCCRWEINL